MLVEFHSEVGTLIMFGDVAVELLKLMGHSGTVPSAILAADIPATIDRLQRALAQAPPEPQPAPERRDKDEREPRVSLQQRAYPLIELLRRAAEQDCAVLWRKG